jgi:hypothetical protein
MSKKYEFFNVKISHACHMIKAQNINLSLLDKMLLIDSILYFLFIPQLLTNVCSCEFGMIKS